MREYLERIFNSLAFRIIVPLSIIVLLAGFGLYIFILRSVSDFADVHVKEGFLTMSRKIYGVCDDSLAELLRNGLLRDEKSVRIKKALAIGMIENILEENNFKGFIVEDGKVILSAGNPPPELSEIIEKNIKEYSVLQLRYNGSRYYATHAHFEPWEWHILLLKDSAAYSALQYKVDRAYVITGLIFMVTIILSLYFLKRYISNPINRIIAPLKKGDKPEYKGIYEFQFLSDNIGRMIESLKDKEKEKEHIREQLFQSQKLEAIGRLAGGVAHDFNNMLQGILGYAAFLKMKVPVDDHTYKPLSAIEHLAKSAAELTKQLLGFARKGKYLVEPLNLNNIVEDVIAIATKTFDRSIEIKTSLANDLWTIEGDRNQIEHVILNLGINARDAMPSGGTLSIETSNIGISADGKPYTHMEEGKYVVIKVIDTGKGMDKETQQHIFEPFFTTKDIGKGTGMGLAMVYGIIKNHYGHITVDSAPGKGSIFTIYLPAIGENTE